MALYTLKEFAELCGISLANLSTYKSRGKIQLTDNKVDDQIEINASFLKHQLSKKGKLTAEIAQKPTKTDEILVKQEQIIGTKRDHSTTNSPTDTGTGSLHDLNKKKKALEVEKIYEETELLKKKNEKMEGELVPTDMVSALIKLHFTNASNQFKNAIENILTEWTNKKDFSREELALLRGNMTENLNKAITQSVKESQHGLAKLIEEISIKKGIGERN